MKDNLERYFNELGKLDPLFREFAEKHGISIESKDAHNFPERSLSWTSRNGLECLMQVFLNSDERTFRFWICASLDKGGSRFWKQRFLADWMESPLEPALIQRYLEEGFRELSEVKENDLEFATHIAPFTESKSVNAEFDPKASFKKIENEPIDSEEILDARIDREYEEAELWDKRTRLGMLLFILLVIAGLICLYFRINS